MKNEFSREYVQVTAALVDVISGRQVWSETFEGIAGQSFTAQQDIAVEIAGYLEVSLGDQRKHGGTTSFEAFRAYLRAIESQDIERISSLNAVLPEISKY